MKAVYEATVPVVFKVDENGVMYVSATEESTGKVVKIDVTSHGTGRLTEA